MHNNFAGLGAMLTAAALNRSISSVASRQNKVATDGLTTFSVMWALALILSVASHYDSLLLSNGWKVALVNYATLVTCVALIVRPRNIWLLLVLAGFMATQYVGRLPVASNNQTIAFFMNVGILAVLGNLLVRGESLDLQRGPIYENLRIIARCLLATMYFYGIFHKINVDFLDPEVSCAVALYQPLVHLFGFEDSLFGRYGAISVTFIVEIITLICLFWRRFFAFGLILGLAFHYIIPISAYSWYMDFSSLVFALYTLSIPREASIKFYERGANMLRRFRSPSGGGTAIVALVVLLVAAIMFSLLLRAVATGLVISDRMVWHSSWMVIWTTVGGISMVWLCGATLEILPYRSAPVAAHSRWVYIVPGVLFLSCLSPYLGLKTESSISMFSNLHTEGGTTNHLLFAKPPYIASYQSDVAHITGSSMPKIQALADEKMGMVRFEIERFLRKHPKAWISFDLNGRH